MSGTTIMACSCASTFQDETYGKGNRLHNLSEDSKKAYCTVCSPSYRRNKDANGRPPRKAKTV